MDHLSSETAGAAPVTGAAALMKIHKGEGSYVFITTMKRDFYTMITLFCPS